MSVELRSREASVSGILKPVASRLGAPLARAVTHSQARVLMYHRFGAGAGSRRLDPAVFARQLEYLVRHFRVAALSDVVRALRSGQRLPRGLVAITIDDGYGDFVDLAYPVLQRFGTPATVFAATRFLDGTYWLWFDALHYLLHTTRVPALRVTLAGSRLSLDLSSAPSRERAWSAVGTHCLGMDPATRNSTIEHLQHVLQVPLPAAPTNDYRAMSWAEAAGLDPSLVTIGSHTCTHPVLSRCTDAEIEWEIAHSRRTIAGRLGRRVDAFCYPNGQPEDYDIRCVNAVKAAGYTCATVAHGATVGTGSDVYTLERMAAPFELPRFQSAVDGVTKLADQWRSWRSATTS
jgi:peptidoglycan/xylan/chitin deacetylase (PgdA/CDA1 family)